MHTRYLAHPGHSGSGVLSSLGFALLRFPVRGAPGAQGVSPPPVHGRHTVRDAALQLNGQPHAPAAVCDVNQVLRRMVRIARTLVPPGIRIAERYAALDQPGAELPEFHQVVLHLILDAAQAVNGCGTIDVTSRCVGGEVCIDITDTRASRSSGWGLMVPLLGAGVADRAESQSLGLVMAGDFAEEHGGRVTSKRLVNGGHVVTIAFPLALQALA